MQPDQHPRAAERTRARRLPRAVRERQILDAAVEVFAERGFHPASMDEISETAGISKPMIYAYLGSKDELFLTCLRREATRLIDAIGESVDPDLGPDEQLWRGLQQFFAYVHEHRTSWAVLHRQASSQGEPFSQELATFRSRAMGLISTLLARATVDSQAPMTPEQLEPFASALVGACESLIDWWIEHPEHTADGMAMRVMNLTWMGFGDLIAGRTWSPAEPS